MCNHNPSYRYRHESQPTLVLTLSLSFLTAMEDSEQCGWVYFTLLALIYPLLLAQIVWGIYYLIDKQRVEKRVKGDIRWKKFTILVPFLGEPPHPPNHPPPPL